MARLQACGVNEGRTGRRRLFHDQRETTIRPRSRPPGAGRATTSLDALTIAEVDGLSAWLPAFLMSGDL